VLRELYTIRTNFSTLKRVVKGQCSCRPLRESRHTKLEKVKCKCTKGSDTMGHAKEHILLVDDDPGIMAAVNHSLSTNGYKMTTATDGVHAVAAFGRGLPARHLL